jgi:hypothetical protein
MKRIRDISNLDHPCHAMNVVACDAHANARPGPGRLADRLTLGAQLMGKGEKVSLHRCDLRVQFAELLTNRAGSEINMSVLN